jgi:hypothetical protein
MGPEGSLRVRSTTRMEKIEPSFIICTLRLFINVTESIMMEWEGS